MAEPDRRMQIEVHPLIAELFKLLPPPGSEWPAERRAAWLNAAVAAFAFLYPMPEAEQARILARRRMRGWSWLS